MDWSPRTSEKINGIKTGSKNITNKKNRQRLSEQPNSSLIGQKLSCAFKQVTVLS
jgi:hypothetical protein